MCLCEKETEHDTHANNLPIFKSRGQKLSQITTTTIHLYNAIISQVVRLVTCR